MEKSTKVVVVGLGEVGKPLLDVISKYHDTVGVDLAPLAPVGPVEVLHICYPFEIKDFIGECARYVERYQPRLTVINSTVAIGTTRAVAQRTGAAVVNSPVRGKHVRMREELQSYCKFVGALHPADGEHAAKHFQSVGLKTKVLSTPEASELAKLTETTYFGVMIAWAQEVERYCDQTGASYDEVVSFYDEIKYLPPVRFLPGIIGGHCVMPNIKILNQFSRSVILDAIHAYNGLKIDRESQKGSTAASATNGLARLTPIPHGLPKSQAHGH